MVLVEEVLQGTTQNYKAEFLGRKCAVGSEIRLFFQPLEAPGLAQDIIYLAPPVGLRWSWAAAFAGLLTRAKFHPLY